MATFKKNMPGCTTCACGGGTTVSTPTCICSVSPVSLSLTLTPGLSNGLASTATLAYQGSGTTFTGSGCGSSGIVGTWVSEEFTYSAGNARYHLRCGGGGIFTLSLIRNNISPPNYACAGDLGTFSSPGSGGSSCSPFVATGTFTFGSSSSSGTISG